MKKLNLDPNLESIYNLSSRNAEHMLIKSNKGSTENSKNASQHSSNVNLPFQLKINQLQHQPQPSAAKKLNLSGIQERVQEMDNSNINEYG